MKKSTFELFIFKDHMEEREFIVAVKNNDFLKSVIADNSFSNVDVSQFTYTELWDDHYEFMEFPVGRWVFNKVRISLSTGDISIVFKMANSAFSDELPSIVGTGPTFQMARSPEELSVMRTKVGKVEIEGKIVRVDYLISEHYGSEIKFFIVGPNSTF